MIRDYNNKTNKSVMRLVKGDTELDEATLMRLFLKHLDNIYCVKKHLVALLPSIAEKASFADLRAAIIDNIDLIKIQVLRMDVIYKIVRAEFDEANCTAIKDFSIDALANSTLSSDLSFENDLTLLIHLQIIENHEIAYFNVLKNLAVTLRNAEIDILLEQNFEASVSSKNLYELIAKEHLGT